MTYLWLSLAIISEAGWAIAMKLSSGLTRPSATVATVILYLLSVVFLALATRRLDLSTAYATWAGSGAVIIALAGFLYFREPATAIKVASIGLIVLGIIGLQWSDHRTPRHQEQLGR